MKILLDENLPHQMRLEIVGHDVATIAYLGWAGVENGLLLQRAAAAGFDVLVTNDRGLEYEQNLATLPVSVVVILATANTMDAIRPLLPKLHSALAQLRPREFVKVTSE